VPHSIEDECFEPILPPGISEPAFVNPLQQLTGNGLLQLRESRDELWTAPGEARPDKRLSPASPLKGQIAPKRQGLPARIFLVRLMKPAPSNAQQLMSCPLARDLLNG
jgi:hypothetical protein